MIDRYTVEKQKKILDNESIDYPFLRKEHKKTIKLLKERREKAYSGQLDGDKAILRADILCAQAENGASFEKIKQIDAEIDYLQKQSRKISFSCASDKDTLKSILRHTAQNLGKQISKIISYDFPAIQRRGMPDYTIFYYKNIQGTHWDNGHLITYTAARKIQKECIAAMEEEYKNNDRHINIAREIDRLTKIKDSILEKMHSLNPIPIPYLMSVDLDKKIDNFINSSTLNNGKVIEEKNSMVAKIISSFSQFLYDKFSKDDIIKDNATLKSLKDRNRNCDINGIIQKQKQVLNTIRNILEDKYGENILKGIILERLNEQIKYMTDERTKDILNKVHVINTTLSQADKYIKEYATKDIFKDKNYSDIKDKLIYLYNKINEKILTMNGWVNKIKEFEPMINDFYNSIKNSSFDNFADYFKSRERQKMLLNEISLGTFTNKNRLNDTTLKEFIYG